MLNPPDARSDRLRSAVWTVVGAASLLGGCGAGNVSPAMPAAVTYGGVSFTATILAGTKPISGASVALYAAGTGGIGSKAASLLSHGAVTTGADGTATIPATYNCPATGSMLYLVSTGGAVSGQATANPEAVLLGTIGPCSVVTPATKVVLNEATTVASVYALAQFYSPTGNLGASATNATGLSNAFATAATLADPATGAVPGPTLPANADFKVARLNSIANLVNACVVDESACAGFFSAAAQTGSPAGNTLDAVYNLARAPAAEAASLFTQSQASSAYAPALAKTPADWTLFITYSGGGLNSPSGLGVDSSGSVWVANYFYTASKFSPVGAPAFPMGITGFGLNNSYGLAIDANDNVWIPNEQPYFGTDSIGSVSELTSAGVSLAGNSGYTGAGLNYPIAVAIDPNGTVWVVDYGDSHVTLLNASGQALSGAQGYATASFEFPVVVAVDANHFGWVGNLSNGGVTKVAADGSSFTSYQCCDGAAGIALDQQNNAWIANYYGASVSMIAADGSIVSNQGYTGLGSLDHPQGITVDGAGDVWVANYRAPYLTELAGASAAVPGASLTRASGMGADAGLREAYALALDASGNIWVSNQGSNTLTKFIGLAVPVKTPLSGLPQAP